MSSTAVCIGDNCIDTYLPPQQGQFIGGNAVNTAVHMQRAGCPAAYVGVVGDDPQGRSLIDRLEENGIDASFVQVAAGKTAWTEVRLSADGDRIFVYENLGPKDQFAITPALLSFLHRHKLVHNTWLGGTEDHLKDFKIRGGPSISMDYGERYTPDFLERTLAWVDIAFFSMEPSQLETARDFARQMRARGPACVVVTLADQGSLVCFADQQFHFEPALPVEVVDTLGAGDTFIGTFLAHHVLGQPIPACMRLAAQAAAQTCSYFGAFPNCSL